MVIVSVYICASEDGFIADKMGGVSWLPPIQGDIQKNYDDYFASVDVVIMGSRSYEQVHSFGMNWPWPYSGKISYIFSKRDLKPGRDDIKITGESPQAFLNSLKSSNPEVKKIWLMGGAALIKSFEKENLIDEIILFTANKKIKEGIPLGVDLSAFKVVEDNIVEDLKFKIYKK